MSFEEPNDPRSTEIDNNQIQLTDLVTYEERTPGPDSTLFYCNPLHLGVRGTTWNVILMEMILDHKLKGKPVEKSDWASFY